VEVAGNIYVVEDRTAKRFDGRYDIYFASHREALKFGKRSLRVKLTQKTGVQVP
jgi:3D (Asp-Asp-Asp) domain-containing protein